MDFVLCPADKYMFKVNNKKIWLIYWMSSKLKVNTSWHCLGLFIVDIDHSQHINIVLLLLTLKKFKVKNFNFNFIIAPNWNKLRIFDNTSALNLLYESQLYYRFVPLFDLLYHRYFIEFFLLYETENLFISLKQWNKLVGI